jgi:hypothetical protein
VSDGETNEQYWVLVSWEITERNEGNGDQAMPPNENRRVVRQPPIYSNMSASWLFPESLFPLPL